MDMMVGNNKKMNLLGNLKLFHCIYSFVVKYGENKSTEEDRKHPEFDDPLLEMESPENLSSPTFDNRGGLSEDFSYKEYNETRLTAVGPRLSHEYTRHSMDFMFNILNSFMFKYLDSQDPTYPEPLMDYLFGSKEQLFLSNLYSHAVKIYQNEDYITESIDFLVMISK